MIRSTTWFGFGELSCRWQFCCPFALPRQMTTGPPAPAIGACPATGAQWAYPATGTMVCPAPGPSQTSLIPMASAAPLLMITRARGALSSLTVDLTGGSGTASNTLSMSANHLTVSSEFSTVGAGNEIVGDKGTGHFIQSGGTNTLNRGIIYVGFFEGSSGTYNLSGTGSLEANFSSEWVGYKGTGSLYSNWRHKHRRFR